MYHVKLFLHACTKRQLKNVLSIENFIWRFCKNLHASEGFIILVQYKLQEPFACHISFIKGGFKAQHAILNVFIFISQKLFNVNVLLLYPKCYLLTNYRNHILHRLLFAISAVIANKYFVWKKKYYFVHILQILWQHTCISYL
jgi:hypothetical protein